MRDWFANLDTRERIILIAGGAVAAIIVWWGLIWTPLSSRNTELTEAVVEKQRMLATLQRARAATTTSETQVDAATRQSLVLLVDQTHRSFGLEGRLLRTQPDGADGIRVTFQDAAFDGLIGWLGTMQTSYGIAVESATIDGARSAGVINATIVLRRI
ncbi:MAG TPA: type II secretion system protein M [Gammaproteobacteria bacterium]|nr:type II secretion system protein M [Gammaproteobacteria bacterium]